MWSLEKLFSELHKKIVQDLSAAQSSFGHAPTTGDATQDIWIRLFNDYLPKRYRAVSGQLIDSLGNRSNQIDVIIFDNQYTPPILNFSAQNMLAVESAYAIFEVKQNLNEAHLRYAQEKAASVRSLHRTSLPIPHAGGRYKAKALTQDILAGILTLDSDWKPPLGDIFQDKLNKQQGSGILDIGCVARHGVFYKQSGRYYIANKQQAVPFFILELIAQLQSLGTVPMVDTRAYAQWLRNLA